MSNILDEATATMELRGMYVAALRERDTLRADLARVTAERDAAIRERDKARETIERERRHPAAPDRCPCCNWTNTNLLNYGLVPNGEPLWLCHGCAARKLDESRRPGLTLTAEERAAVVFALGCLDATREKQRSRAPLSQLLAEADKHSATIDRLLAGARTVTEPTADDVDFGEVGRMRERVARTYALSTEAGRSHALAVLRALVVDLQCAVAADAAARGGK